MRKYLFLLLALVFVSCDKDDEISEDIYYKEAVGDWIVTENTDESFKLERYIFSEDPGNSYKDTMYVDGRKIDGFSRSMRRDTLYLATYDKPYLYKITIISNKMTWIDASKNTIKFERQ